MATYYLAEHVHACLANGHIIFLDIKKDRYSALPPDLSKALTPLVAKRAVSAEEFGQAPPDVHAAVADLIGKGHLRTSAPGPTKLRLRAIDRPRRDLSEANIEGRHPVTLVHFANFLFAYCRAVVGTRILGIDRLLRGLSRHKHRDTGNEPPEYTLREAVDALRRIRIFFYKETDHCYFDCAVHMYFLRRYGFDPVWIFSVKMNPFHAHCWVQVEDTIVTSHLGEIGLLRPILAV